MPFILGTLIYVAICIVLVAASIKLHPFLKRIYPAVEAAPRFGIITFAFGVTTWIIKSYFGLNDFYVDLFIVAPTLIILLFMILFYAAYVPAYIFWGVEAKVRNLFR